MILKGFNNFFMSTHEIRRLRPKIVFFLVWIFSLLYPDPQIRICLFINDLDPEADTGFK